VSSDNTRPLAAALSRASLHRAQLYLAVPQVLLPVMPHLTSELDADSPAQRLEATQLLGRLLSLPGNKLVSEYQDVLDTLLLRYADPDVRCWGGRAGGCCLLCVCVRGPGTKHEAAAAHWC
jgi:hypothetical protein